MTAPPRSVSSARTAAGAALTALLCATGVAWITDGYTRHGWSASWYATVDGERVLITETTEHRITFPNAHRPLARYVQGWPFERVAMPEQLPSIDVELHGILTVPDSAHGFLAVDSDGQVELEMDGAAELPLSPGDHTLRIRWQSQPSRHLPRLPPRHGPTHLTLRWGASPNALEAVPAGALTPGAGAWPSARVLGVSFGILGGALFGVWLFFGVVARESSLRRRRLAALATATLIVLGTAYRAWDYDVMPEFRENADELFATWNGWSLLAEGTPRGWSLWPHAYDDRVSREEVRFFGETRTVIEPYFEHPPLLHLLVGAAAHLGGAEHWLESRLAHTRLVPIGLSAVALWLMVAIGRRIFGHGPAPFLGGLLYAVIPTVALQTRVIKEEVLLVVLSLGMVWFFLRWRDDGRKLGDLVFAAVLAGLGPLAKVPAVVWVPALAMLVASERGETRRAFFAAGIGLLTASTLLVYGAVIDWDVFMLTQAAQGGRPTHWNLFPRFFDATLINHTLIGRGWILFLWLGFAASVMRRGRRETAPLTVPLVTYLFAIAIGSGNWTFGWYIVPLYPFLCLGAGDFLARLWKQPTLLPGVLFTVLLVMYTLNFALDPDWAKQPSSWPSLRRLVTVTAAAFIAPYALAQVWSESGLTRRLARLSMVTGLVTFVVISGQFIASYDVNYDTYGDFDRDTYFHR